jgi:hypothetical protein
MISNANNAYRVALAAVAEAAAAAVLQDGSRKATGVLDLRRFAKASSAPWWRMTVRERGVRICLGCNTRLEAACAYDLTKLALHGRAVNVRLLNLPAAVYTQRQVAALQQLLRQVIPSRQLPAVDAAAIADIAAAQAIQAAARAAVAAAAEAAASLVPEQATLFSGLQRLPCSSWVSRSNGSWRMLIPEGQCVDARFQIFFSSCLQAACAADLARLALGRKSFTNLPRKLYTGQQVDAMGALLLQEQPAWRHVLQEAAAPVVTTPQLADLKAAAKQAALAAAAVQAAPEQAAAFGAFNQHQQQQRPICCMQIPNQSWITIVRLPRPSKGKFAATWFKDALTAACVADLARLALYGDKHGQRWFNLPVHIYSTEQAATGTGRPQPRHQQQQQHRQVVVAASLSSCSWRGQAAAWQQCSNAAAAADKQSAAACTSSCSACSSWVGPQQQRCWRDANKCCKAGAASHGGSSSWRAGGALCCCCWVLREHGAAVTAVGAMRWDRQQQAQHCSAACAMLWTGDWHTLHKAHACSYCYPADPCKLGADVLGVLSALSTVLPVHRLCVSSSITALYCTHWYMCTVPCEMEPSCPHEQFVHYMAAGFRLYIHAGCTDD